MNYATLDQVKKALNITDTSDDQLLLRLLITATKIIDRERGRRHDIRFEIRYFDRPKESRNIWTTLSVEPPLRLDDDLLEITQLINGDGTVVSDSSILLEPAGRSPSSRVRLKPQSGVTWASDNQGNEKQIIGVSGFWGYHDDYTSAWEDSLDAIQNDPLSDETSVISVQAANGVTENMFSPRFEVGMLLRIDNELMMVKSINLELQTLNVVRAYNGSQAVQHSKNASINIYRVMPNIVQACVRLVMWMYRLKDTDSFDKVYTLGVGVSIPVELPVDVIRLIGGQKVRF